MVFALQTHHLQWLSAADKIVVLNEGRVANMGTYEDLVSSGINFHKFELQAPEGINDGDMHEDGANSPQIDRTSWDGREDAIESRKHETSSSYADRKDKIRDVTAHGSSIRTFPQESTGTIESNGFSHVDLMEENELEELEEVPLLKPHDETQSANTIPDADDELYTSQQICETAETAGAVTVPMTTTQTVVGSNAQKDRSSRNGQLTQTEGRAVGQVKRKVYAKYFNAWGPAFIIPSAVLLLALIEKGLQSGQNWWLSIWSE